MNSTHSTARFEHHVFVCTHEREAGKGCCAAGGGLAVLDRFKSVLREHGLAERIRANRSGCLDACSRGVTVVIYPDAVWYGGVVPADVHEIVESHLKGGRPVERLFLRCSTECDKRPGGCG
ncbi:MAG: (2Fe-2S) ferredoxin domain-containing protein [Planctomycetes bacterium]|nr:(2Fe-2S) ferredoxin domain-containing protein [Planctomycetota bacterium]